MLNVHDQSVTKLGLPLTKSVTYGIISYQDKILYGLSTVNGEGLFRYDPVTKEADRTPYITTEGTPILV